MISSVSNGSTKPERSKRSFSDELLEEWSYRYSERLGILCGAGEPTPEQKRIAGDEADAAIEELKRLP